MLNFINKNLTYLQNYPIFKNNNDFIKEMTLKLNKDKIIVITGMRGLHKTSIVKEFLEKTKSTNYLYINDELDLQNTIKDDKDFFELLKIYEQKFIFCSIIILQNINKVKNIKQLILDLYKSKKYKIIILGNNIHIDTTKELEIHNDILIQNNNLSIIDWQNYLTYGNLPEVKFLNNDYFKKLFLDNIKNKIVLQDIITNYSIKTVISLYQSISKIAFLNTNLSIREFHRNIKDEGIDIALATFMDYIDFLVNSRLLKRCVIYDLKLDKSINTNVKYYFTDLGIRNTFAGEKIDNNILVENMVYNNLITKYTEVYNGLNGRFEFSFYIRDDNSCIHITLETNIHDIKKEVNKLNKIELKGEKVLILSHLDMINYKETIDGVKVVGLNNY
ncbi:MAG: AAA family ATPase [Candidatus Gracilibacteria bacterium]